MSTGFPGGLCFLDHPVSGGIGLGAYSCESQSLVIPFRLSVLRRCRCLLSAGFIGSNSGLLQHQPNPYPVPFGKEPNSPIWLMFLTTVHRRFVALIMATC